MTAICSSIYWLLAEEKRILSESQNSSVLNDSSKSSSIDWLNEIINSKPIETKYSDIKHQSLDKLKSFVQSLDKVRELKPVSFKDMNQSGNFNRRISLGYENVVNTLKVKENIVNNSFSNVESEESGFLLDPYDSDVDNQSSDDSDNEDERNKNDSENDDDFGLPQIIYCSRTHSQISQFVNEIKKTNDLFKNIRCISIGSRKNLCINSDLKSEYINSSDARLSEACLELIKNKKEKVSVLQDVSVSTKKRKLLSDAKSCVYHNNKAELFHMKYSLARTHDIEELVTLGQTIGACPYFSTRKAIKYAQIVCSPYSTLLQEDLRNSVGIKLKNRVVIFDEAHNVIDTINQLHSAEVTDSQFTIGQTAIESYLSRFRTLLHGKNLYYINVLHITIKRLLHFLSLNKRSSDLDVTKSQTSLNPNDFEMYSSNDFIFNAEIDNINFIKLVQYISKSNLVNRIGGYADHLYVKSQLFLEKSNLPSNNHNNDNLMPSKKSHLSALRGIIALIKCLMSADIDGRVSVHRQNARTSSGAINKLMIFMILTVTVCCVLDTSMSTSSASSSPSKPSYTVKYILFNPSNHFNAIVSQAKSVIMLGGTMKPFSYLVSSLFSSVPSSRIHTFSCSHIIASNRVKALIMPSITNSVTGLDIVYKL